MIFPDIGGKPALQPSPLIVVGAGAFGLEFIPGLEPVDEKIADVFPCLGKALY